MAGLRKIAKAYGGMVINGQRWVWDYAADMPVPEAQMPADSERWKQRERIRWNRLA
jgi:hypothetical protein